MSKQTRLLTPTHTHVRAGIMPSERGRRGDKPDRSGSHGPSGLVAPETAGLPVDDAFNYLALLKRCVARALPRFVLHCVLFCSASCCAVCHMPWDGCAVCCVRWDVALCCGCRGAAEAPRGRGVCLLLGCLKPRAPHCLTHCLSFSHALSIPAAT